MNVPIKVTPNHQMKLLMEFITVPGSHSAFIMVDCCFVVGGLSRRARRLEFFFPAVRHETGRKFKLAHKSNAEALRTHKKGERLFYYFSQGVF